jgi:thiamine pyrophosphate-dependent acetolactate synthase large subunit-like protein
MALVSSISKGSAYLDDSGLGFRYSAECAMSETPGPVLLQISPNYHELYNELNYSKVVHDNLADDSRVIELITKAKKVLLIVGSIAVRKNLKEKLEGLSIPIFTTVAAKGIISEYSVNCAGVYTGVGLSLTPEYTLLQEADLIIGIGLCAKEVLSVKKFHCKSINVAATSLKDIDGFQFDFIADENLIEDVLDKLLIADRWGINDLLKINQGIEHYFGDDFMPGKVFYFLNVFFQNKARFILDTGYFCTIAEHALKITAPSLCLMSGQSRYMGTSMPMAIGAALTDLNVINIMVAGDGGIGMYISEVKIAVEYKLPLIIILMSDGGFGSIRTASINKSLTEKPLVFSNPSWVSVFRGFGVNSYKCSSIKSMEEVLLKWNLSDGPLFMELMFSPEKYQNMIKEIR